MALTGGNVTHSMKYVCDLIYANDYEVCHFNAVLLNIPHFRYMWNQIYIPDSTLTTFIFDCFCDKYYETFVNKYPAQIKQFLFTLLGKKMITIMMYDKQAPNYIQTNIIDTFDKYSNGFIHLITDKSLKFLYNYLYNVRLFYY